jgi:hypothetical protein
MVRGKNGKRLLINDGGLGVGLVVVVMKERNELLTVVFRHRGKSRVLNGGVSASKESQ